MFIGRRKPGFKGGYPQADSAFIFITKATTAPTWVGVAVFLHGPLALASQLLTLLVDISLFNLVEGVVLLGRDDLGGVDALTYHKHHRQLGSV